MQRESGEVNIEGEKKECVKRGEKEGCVNRKRGGNIEGKIESV